MDDSRSRLISGAVFGFFQTLFMAFAMLIPTMYFSSLNISIVLFAFLLSIGDVFSFILKPIIGHYTDAHGERKYLLIGVMIFVISLFLIGQTSSIGWITALKIIGGVASAIVYVLILIYSLRKVDKNPEGKVGVYGGISNLGWAVGMFIPGLFADKFGISMSFYLILVVGLAWFLLIFKFARSYKSKVSVKPSFSFIKKIHKLIIYKTMDLAVFSAFLFYFTRYALKDLGLSRSAVSSVVVVEVLIFAASIFFIGRFSNKAFRRYHIPIVIALHFCVAVIMVYANALFYYYIAGILIGLAGGFMDVWIYSAISETFKHEEKGKVIATYGWSFDLATIVGAQVPLLFIAFGLGVFSALYFFPAVILATYIVGRLSSSMMNA